MIMKNLPKVLIVRYYELTWIDVTYSNNSSSKYLYSLNQKLSDELIHNKHLESFEIFYNWENILEEK